MLYVDSSWSGLHGIGRFASEVIARLDNDYLSLDAGRPSSPRDIVSPRRFGLKRNDLLWSPGYNVGLTRAAQFPTVHDLIHLQDEHQRSPLKTRYYETFLRPVIRRNGMVFTVSDTSSEFLSEWLKDRSVRVVNVGNGTSSAFLQGAPRRPEAGSFVMVTTSKPHKNLAVALRALALRRQYLLRIVTSDVEAVASLVAQAGVTRQVSILLNLSDEELAEEYQKATALIFPSIIEGFGLPALEAMQCSCPVMFWSGCASVAEITAGEGFRIKSSSDEEEWASGMDEAAANAAHVVDMPASWKLRYDWDEVARKVTGALRARMP